MPSNNYFRVQLNATTSWDYNRYVTELLPQNAYDNSVGDQLRAVLCSSVDSSSGVAEDPDSIAEDTMSTLPKQAQTIYCVIEHENQRMLEILSMDDASDRKLRGIYSKYKAKNINIQVCQIKACPERIIEKIKLEIEGETTNIYSYIVASGLRLRFY